MALSRLNNLYDPIRAQFVRATPEEKIRQQVIQKMIGELGYPKGLIAIEKDLDTSSRRFDILCYVKKDSELRPLLLIECKADKIDEEAEAQAFGYNQSMRAPFIALASKEGIKTLWREQGRIASVPFLPRYEQLVEQL
jgi:hypothetical protein